LLAVVIITPNVMDKEFTHAKEKISDFKEELKLLMKKYNFEIHESDNYNGMDEYCGTDCYFSVEGYIWYSETISEILNDAGLK